MKICLGEFPSAHQKDALTVFFLEAKDKQILTWSQRHNVVFEGTDSGGRGRHDAFTPQGMPAVFGRQNGAARRAGSRCSPRGAGLTWPRFSGRWVPPCSSRGFPALQRSSQGSCRSVLNGCLLFGAAGCFTGLLFILLAAPPSLGGNVPPLSPRWGFIPPPPCPPPPQPFLPRPSRVLPPSPLLSGQPSPGPAPLPAAPGPGCSLGGLGAAHTRGTPGPGRRLPPLSAK